MPTAFTNFVLINHRLVVVMANSKCSKIVSDIVDLLERNDIYWCQN